VRVMEKDTKTFLIPDSKTSVNPQKFKGRGASQNPANRFERVEFFRNYDWSPELDPAPETEFFIDSSKTAIAYNSSPDIPFDASINPYRGCEHGCIYCYARPSHEYLGFSAGLDFETKIMVKENLPGLLRRELSSPKWKPQVISISGVTDAYQPIERRLELTRRCLEVLAEFRNPVMIVTKSYLVTRDIDLLRELSEWGAACVLISVTTLEPELSNLMEPRAPLPELRIKAIETLTGAGIPTGVLIAPVIPGLTDHEIPSLIEAVSNAGAGFLGYVPLRLPGRVEGLFEQWLDENMAEKKNKILNRQRSLRGGKLNDPGFFTRMKGSGVFSEQIESLFDVYCKKFDISMHGPTLSTEHFRRPQAPQAQGVLPFS